MNISEDQEERGKRQANSIADDLISSLEEDFGFKIRGKASLSGTDSQKPQTRDTPSMLSKKLTNNREQLYKAGEMDVNHEEIEPELSSGRQTIQKSNLKHLNTADNQSIESGVNFES